MAASGTRTSDAMLLRAVGAWLVTPARPCPRLGHRRAGYAVAAVLAPVLAVVPAILHGELNPATGVLAGLVAALAVVAGLLAENAARSAGQAAAAAAESEAARPIAEADRMRTALLATVGHDLRTPLAAAKAAVSCLRATDIQLTAEDHDELLATADESLGQLSHLLASLLDVSRLQAGALPVFPRPANLAEIIAGTLAGIGPQARAVIVRIPPELPRIMVDPSLLERVIANVTANALRYSPTGSPPLLTASAGGGKVILRVVDYGPGVPETDRDRIFAAFQRLGDNDSAIGVGLGLTVSRCLAEAMHGTLKPEETPGGGLTMAIAVPVASGAAEPRPGSPVRGERKGPAHPRRAAQSGDSPPAVIGSSQVTVVPLPTGLCTENVPPSASIRSCSPRSPEPRNGSAPPTPLSRTRTRSLPPEAAAPTSTTEARACFSALASISETT
jgi:signal transduction histidine kinase